MSNDPQATKRVNQKLKYNVRKVPFIYDGVVMSLSDKKLTDSAMVIPHNPKFRFDGETNRHFEIVDWEASAKLEEAIIITIRAMVVMDDET